MSSRLGWILALAAAAAWPGRAAEPSVEERLRALEQTVQRLSQENRELRQQLGWKDAAPPVLVANTFSGRRTMWGVDAALKTKPFELQGEVLGGTLRPANAVPAREVEPLAWHALAAWNALPGRLQLALRREAFDARGAPGVPDVDVWGLGLNWFIRGDDLKLQVNWLEGDNPGTAADGGRLLTRMQVVF